MNDANPTCRTAAPLFAVDDGLAVDDDVPLGLPELGLALCCGPSNLTLSVEMLNPVVVGARLIPVPLTQRGLPGAPAVKFTPAH